MVFERSPSASLWVIDRRDCGATAKEAKIALFIEAERGLMSLQMSKGGRMDDWCDQEDGAIRSKPSKRGSIESGEARRIGG